MLSSMVIPLLFLYYCSHKQAKLFLTSINIVSYDITKCMLLEGQNWSWNYSIIICHEVTWLWSDQMSQIESVNSLVKKKVWELRQEEHIKSFLFQWSISRKFCFTKDIISIILQIFLCLLIYIYNRNSSLSFYIEKDKLSCWKLVKSGTYIYSDLYHQTTLKLDHTWQVKVFGGVSWALAWLTSVK